MVDSPSTIGPECSLIDIASIALSKSFDNRKIVKVPRNIESTYNYYRTPRTEKSIFTDPLRGYSIFKNVHLLCIQGAKIDESAFHLLSDATPTIFKILKNIFYNQLHESGFWQQLF